MKGYLPHVRKVQRGRPLDERVEEILEVEEVPDLITLSLSSHYPLITPR
jgi:hypothetical protein